MLSPVSSVTHAHIVYVLGAERPLPGDRPFRILDAGCGNGALLIALHRHLPGLIGRPVELYGFDVSDVRVQKSDFFSATIESLRAAAPETDWQSRLSLIDTQSPWPYDDSFFDAVVSNQVLEHVQNLDSFLGELSRVLRRGGISVNLFPVKALAFEGHVGVPFAHRIHSDDVRRAYLTNYARLGVAKIGPMRKVANQSAQDFGETRAEYVATQTAYRSFRELAAAAHRQGLTASYRWTPQFYSTKLAYVFGRDFSALYRRGRQSVLFEFFAFRILSRISSVTIVFESLAAYDPDAENAGHLG